MFFNSDELKKALKVVKLACSKDKSRPMLTGINFKCKDGICVLAGMDGYRLHVEVLKYEGSENTNFTIPYFDVPRSSKSVDVQVSKDLVRLDFGDGIKQDIPQIKGEYFNYEKVKPNEKPVFSIAFNPQLLKDAIKVEKDDIVLLDFYGHLSPCILRNATFHRCSDRLDIEESYRFISPIRVGGI